MLKLYHGPQSRSTRAIALLAELDAMDKVEIIPTSIPRQNGSGGADPNNPHPEGKVPFIVDGEDQVWESPAVLLYLCEKFGPTDLAPEIGAPGRGRLLSWLHYYGGVVEPVLVGQFAGVDHPAFHATFRGPTELAARLEAALSDAPYIMGETYTLADLLLSSPFHWFAEATPDVPAIREWVARCAERPSQKFAMEYDAKLREAAGATAE